MPRENGRAGDHGHSGGFWCGACAVSGHLTYGLFKYWRLYLCPRHLRSDRLYPTVGRRMGDANRVRCVVDRADTESWRCLRVPPRGDRGRRQRGVRPAWMAAAIVQNGGGARGPGFTFFDNDRAAMGRTRNRANVLIPGNEFWYPLDISRVRARLLAEPPPLSEAHSTSGGTTWCVGHGAPEFTGGPVGCP